MPDLQTAGRNSPASSNAGAGAWLCEALSLRGVVCAFVLYGFMHGAISLLAGSALALDDAKLNVVAQSFQLGYFPTNPPLYEWLLILVQSVTGPGLAGFLVLKYLLLTAAGAFTYLAGKEVFQSRLWAAVGALSLTLLYQIGWNYHQAFTHSAALIAATAFFWHRAFVLLRDRSAGSYALLGLAMGLGLLAKYSFAAAAVCYLLAALLRPATRAAILSPGMALALAVSALVIAPHAHWLLTQTPLASEAAQPLTGDERSYALRVIAGLPSALWAIAAFFLPFALLAAAAFRRRIAWRAPLPPTARLAGESALIGAGALLLGASLLGMESMQERYVIAFLLPALFWVLAAMRAGAPDAARLKIFAGGAAGVVALIALARLAEAAFPGPPFCTGCRQWMPYEAIADALDVRGFDGEGTLVGFDDNTAGNLRRLYPKARALSSHQQAYVPPAGDATADCFYIWSPQMGPSPPESFLARLNEHPASEIATSTRPLGGERRSVVWIVTQIPVSSPIYEGVCRIAPPRS